jgi:ATP-dependent Clp protease ATP-binding subunit ClpB
MREIDTSDLRCIGTTTPRRYSDLSKRQGFSDYLSDIQIMEPSITETINILRTLTASLTAYHGSDYCVEDAALHQAVSLAKRFMASTGALPKSALHVLDQACALVRTQRSQAFESWDCVQSRRVALQVEAAALKVSSFSIP